MANNWVIRTTLYPPVSRAPLIERARLLELLERNRNRRVTVVAAPAGFGKTTILGQWFERLKREGQLCCWCSLDRDDNQPQRFLRHILSALRTEADIGAEPLRQLDSTFVADIASILPALIDEFVTDGRSIVLFIDDYHYARAEQIHHFVEVLTELAPANLRLVIASRLRPHLSLSSLRMRGQVCEITVNDLRFDSDETRDFMQRTLGLDLSARQMARLYEHSEGWVAGLQLASLSLHDVSRRDAFIGSFSGSLREIADYLATDVLNQQEPKIRDFLLRTAILDRLSAGVVAAVTQNPRARTLLESVERRNLFLVPLDGTGEWYRYHHLFQDFLLAELRRAYPDEIVALYRSASDWFATAGYRNEAVNYALLSGDMLKLGHLVHDGTLESLAMDGKMAELLSWVSNIPQHIKTRFPRLLIQECIALSHLCRSTAAADVAEQARKAIERLPQSTDYPYTEDEVKRLRQEVAVLPSMVAFCRDDVREAEAAALHHLVSSDDLVMAIANNFIGYSALLRHRLVEAEHYFAKGRFHHVTKGTYYGAVISDCLVAGIKLLQFRLAEAHKHTLDAEQLVGEISGGHIPGLAKTKVMQATVLYEWQRSDEALALLDVHLQTTETAGQVSITQHGYLTRARCLHALGRSDEALAALDRCLEVSRHANRDYITVVVETERARMTWLDDPESFAPARGAPLETLLAQLRADWNRVTFARTFLGIQNRILAGRCDGDDSALQEFRHRCRERGLLFAELQLRILAAIAYQKRGRNDAARDCLRDAIAIAAESNGLSRFLDFGPALQPLLAQLEPRIAELTETGQREFLQRLLLASRERWSETLAAPETQREASFDRAEPLSSRELQILEWMARGDSNADIGLHLQISENTVKWHLKNVFAKLSVSNRTAAVITAQQRNLLA